VPIHPAASAFCDLIQKYFGSGSHLLLDNAKSSNKIMEAVVSSTPELSVFRENLCSCLERLAEAYPSPSESRHALLKTLKDTTGKDWKGAYAELVAASYFITARRGTYLEPPVLNVNLDKSRTYSAQLGKKSANVDGHFTRENVYFDVKVLKDNVREILDGIFKEVKMKPGCSELYLMAEYDAAIYCGALANKRECLLKELVRHFDPATKPISLTSSVHPGFSFRATWGHGVSVSMKSYNPYRHAKELHEEVFGHMDKFVRDSPFVLVYVTSKWLNANIIDFRNDNRSLYRSLSRRVFCQYRNSTDTAKEYDAKFSGPETLWDLSRNIAAIAFLEDKTLENTNTKSKVDAFWYLNPNAKNPLRHSLFYDVLAQVLEVHELDDFRDDNY
jgi:hypothetical protein